MNISTHKQIVAALFRDTKVPQPTEDRPEPVFQQFRSFFVSEEPGEEPIPSAMFTWGWLASRVEKRHQASQPWCV